MTPSKPAPSNCESQSAASRRCCVIGVRYSGGLAPSSSASRIARRSLCGAAITFLPSAARRSKATNDAGDSLANLAILDSAGCKHGLDGWGDGKWHDRGVDIAFRDYRAESRKVLEATPSYAHAMTYTKLPTVAVMGAGAVGCYYGGMLALAGVPVTLIGRARHVDAMRRSGLVIERGNRRDVVRVEAATGAEAVRSASVVLVCVKSPDTTHAAVVMKPHLRADSVVVSLQNGVENAQWIAEAIDQVVLAAVVWVGAYMEGPGIVRHNGRGDLVLGVTRTCANRADAAARVQQIAVMFEHAGVKCPIAADIEAALWSKLIVNCGFNAISALGRARYGRMAQEPAIRELMEATVRESLAVARAAGVALDEKDMLASMWRTAEAMSSQYSSTAQDILRGKPTEVDMLNGYIARRAAELGVDAPVNRALHALIKLREAADDLV